MIDQENIESIFTKNSRSLLLIATWLQKDKVLQELLEKGGVPLQAVDGEGRLVISFVTFICNYRGIKLNPHPKNTS